MAELQFGVLGPLEARRGAEPVALRGAKQKALLAVLLLNPNEVVSAERLLDDLWGNDPPASGAHALRVRVSQLRKALDADAAESPIETRAPGYVLALRREQLDLTRFEDHLNRGSDQLARGNASDALEELSRALSLWRGAALADVAEEDFARGAAMRLEELRLHTIELRIEAELALGHHERLVGELQSLLEQHPLNERLRGQLMLTLYKNGRQTEALDVYRRGRERMVEELGIEPGPALNALEQEILRHDPSLAQAASTSAPAGQAPDVMRQRSLLLLPSTEDALAGLLSLAVPMVQQAGHELILMRLVGAEAELSAAAASTHVQRDALAEQGVAARAGAFISDSPAEDALQLATEQTVDLVLADLAAATRPGGVLAPDTLTLLERSPCDVGLLVGGQSAKTLSAESTVAVPFGGGQHDWPAIELAAWIVKGTGSRLELAGVGKAGGRGRDASRLLARASLLLQQALDLPAEPRLVDEGADALLEAVSAADLVVAGLSSREGRRELGSVRLALIERARPPVLLVRKGLRPSGIAPGATMTRFSWSMTGARLPSSV